ncbi:glutamine--fructose-6-phosphate transaminase (isomerizing) [Paraburkholderia sabiae]|uniref:Glutamine--fructose-6-phosphate aminotransferase [isomerizing] n=1 Tax=Paraburkholderia sabiae TaxID=273251 RepID=A0ABU9QSQ1_9BURK|nr:glutamine--fructose-6-phosphate transaminase (isomerizing) [Paraburkholderia sabiae]WJZ79597.1 glutamine--fructose-6-phosphate transaminase (isomerizing) [Paraburkholderia sabiae]CAD6563348.1 Glutamine--fructose-6-phosphate aminotransferase [isomerizing] [Paraburkholderia sabiae]
MCGIVGAVAHRNIVPVLIEGLRRLEYRGYDSCGMAVLTADGPHRVRSVARVAELDEQVSNARFEGVTGIAHTRWATHGAATINNAHPIVSSGSLAIVHNGIIENYEILREALRRQHYEFVSQTDTEVIAHLIHSLYEGDLFAAVRKAVRQLTGAYAVGVVHKDQPHTLVGARAGSPLVVGYGDGENFIASDALALAGSAEHVSYLEEGDVCEITLAGVRIVDFRGEKVVRNPRRMPAYSTGVELGPYRHYMQKEIFEQPSAIADTIPDAETFSPGLFGKTAGGVFRDIDSVLILACGTSYYAGLTAKYWLESVAKIRTDVEIASEYRYRESVPNPRMLVVAVSQSGETADTLAALKHAQSRGMEHTLAVCNVATSAMVRLTDFKFLTHAGTEIGVASTKAFTTQLVALFILAVTLGKMRGHVSDAQETEYLHQLRHLPAALNAVLALEPQIIAWSDQFAHKENALFLGRGLHYPIALEGALKLKEISYIHAEAYSAGELKHGPLALVTDAMPVVTVAPNDALLDKLKSNMQEVRARGGHIYVFADDDTHITSEDGIHVIRMPEHYGLLSPILHVVPLQLLAYHTACARGTDVDKPRNLAKSVTVE